jgi:5-aminopentanamidase
MAALDLIRARVDWCESAGVNILCCPEAVLGGLADYAARPSDIAVDAEGGQLDQLLKPLASASVTTIVGFTEHSRPNHLYNSAAVLHKGHVVGVYRKLHPAIRKSIYQAGDRIPVFTVDGLTFGVAICNDSNYPDIARAMASQGAVVLFVPTNNSLPEAEADVVGDARRVDVGLAKDNRLWVFRADVAGRTSESVSCGSSGIVDPDGTVVQSAGPLTEELLVADIPLPVCCRPCPR